jgi:shikimate dehydrogenase
MALMDSDTQLCVSLAARPGSFGNRFHNYLYGELHLNFAYRSGTTQDLEGAIHGLRALGIRGCGLSMPFKEQVLDLLDEVDPVARKIGAVNTIVNDDVRGKGFLKGYNTDHVAVYHQLKNRGVGPTSRVAVAGSGGMARAVAYALDELKCRNVVILARNRETGESLAQTYTYRWRDPSSTQAGEPGEFDVLINASPVGMTPDPVDHMPFSRDWVNRARLVVDSVANPADTALLKAAREVSLATVAGFDLTLSQGVEQFRLYTGVSLRPDQVGRAAVYARHTK